VRGEYSVAGAVYKTVPAGIIEKHVAEDFPSPVKPGPDSSDGTIHKLCDLLVTQAFNVAEDHHRPEFLRQRLEGPGYIVFEQPTEDLAFMVL